VLGIVPISELLNKDLQIDETNSISLLRDREQKAMPTIASSTHRNLSNDSWPTVLGIVPVSELLYKYMQIRRKRRHHLFSPNHRHRCSNSQDRKQRQLAYSARDRARQSIVVQLPAKSTTHDNKQQSLCSDQRKHAIVDASVPTHRD
jgi:hypothetical protein